MNDLIVLQPLSFDSLASFSKVIHGFTLRGSQGESSVVPAPNVLARYGYSESILVQAEQPHGNRVEIVDQSHQGTMIAQADGLVTSTYGIILVIRTADCGALFLYDPEHQAIGLVHSGKKGTDANITQNAISLMVRNYQTDPTKIVAVLGPCIRPPHYETNFPKTIAQQAREAGIQHFTDCGDNTATNPENYYSYRMEKGLTGRHYAFIGLISEEVPAE
ncbi:MAG: polyphenol oxidase family protein [Verrucomicrobiota bacterium]